MREFFKENKIFLAIIVGALIIGGAIYFSHRGGKPPTNQCFASPEAMVTKVIDGDTVIVEGGHSVRLLGIDADERGYPCYQSAKEFLEKLVLNKKVRLERDETDVDQYNRCLRYLFLGNQNINLELVKNGEAAARFFPPDLKYQAEITQAEKEAINNKVGCKWVPPPPPPPNGKEWKNLTPEKTGLELIGACLAGKYLSKEMIVEGKVVDTYRHLKSNTVFLNFEKPYPNQCFTGVIFSSDLYKFVQNPEDYYLGKTIRIKGEIKKYRGRPEIILKTPDQIEVGK